MTACTCDSHTTSTSTAALTCSSTSTGDCINLLPNTNGNGLNCTIISGFGKAINVVHNGSSGGTGISTTTNAGTALYASANIGVAIQVVHTGPGGYGVSVSSGSNAIQASSSSTTAGTSAIQATSNASGTVAVKASSSGGVALSANCSAGGMGVSVTCNTGIGVYATSYVGGVYGSLLGSGNGYAVYGAAGTTNSGAYAGYFDGRVKVINNLSVGAGCNVTGTHYVTGDIYCTGTLYGLGDVSTGGTLYVTGTTTLHGAVTTHSNMSVGGTLTKAAGTFTIDHPSDPANKILNHSFVESPDMKNVYDGRGILDEHGSCTVKLPDYFGDLNENFCYQLTMIGHSSFPLFIEKEINDNEFVVGGASLQKFCWQVTGNRKDAYAKAHPIVVEVEKEVKGTFLYPHVHSK